MNYIEEYQAEIDYRRDKMRRLREPIRLWRRSRSRANAQRRVGTPNIPFR
jgi:hypothetical protein